MLLVLTLFFLALILSPNYLFSYLTSFLSNLLQTLLGQNSRALYTQQDSRVWFKRMANPYSLGNGLKIASHQTAEWSRQYFEYQV
jgi:hypothetical protein